MTAILGIDAAWTERGSSGVALIKLDRERWHCVGLAPSYDAFIALACGRPVDWSQRATGSSPDLPKLLQAAATLANEEIALVTIDMPVATTAVTRRREADQEVSRKFGARGCSTHSPCAVRPGPFGAALSRQFAELGYPIATTATPVRTVPSLVEVYPHPALLTLIDRDRRVPYKVAKAAKYWKGKTVLERIGLLLAEFACIERGIRCRIDNVMLTLPATQDVASLSMLKSYEDALDALVCCWVGSAFLAGDAKALGDETAAIWCPNR